MMTEQQALWVVLAAIYSSECIAWVPAHTVCFSTWFGFNRKWSWPGRLFGNHNGGMVVAPLWPPSAGVFRSRPWPFSLSTAGVFAYVSDAPNGAVRPDHAETFIAWDDVQPAKADCDTLRLGDGSRLRVRSEKHATALVEVLNRLADSDQREQAVDQMLDDSLSVQSVRTRMDEYDTLTEPLLYLANLQFLFVFGIAPVIVWAWGLVDTWLYLLIGLYGLVGLNAAFFRYAHRALYREVPSERWMWGVMMVLNPMAALRGRDLLARELLVSMEPSAVAYVLLPQQQRDDLLRAVLVDLHHPLRPACPEDVTPVDRSIESDYRARRLSAIERMIRAQGDDPQRYSGPPAPADETCVSYCPRCHNQLVIDEGTCEPCGGIPLRPFPGNHSKPNTSAHGV
jgi:hypothetical protein